MESSECKKCRACKKMIDIGQFQPKSRQPNTPSSTCIRCCEVAGIKLTLSNNKSVSVEEREDLERRLQELNLKSGPPTLPGTWIKCGCRSYRNLDEQDPVAMERYKVFQSNPKYCFCMEKHASNRTSDAKRIKEKVTANRERRNEIQVAIASGSLARQIIKDEIIHRYCSGCTRHVPDGEFASRDHRVCKKCADLTRDYDQHRRNLDKRRELFREKRYDLAYRARKREDDPEGFKEHNATIQKNWRVANREHVLNWRHNNWRGYFNGMKSQAAVKGLTWNLTDESAQSLMHSTCFFCGVLPDKGFGGIDRLNFRESYIADNVVPCCKECNFMKGCLDPLTFIDRCTRIAARNDMLPDFIADDVEDAVFVDMGNMNFASYEARARNKHIEFSISEELFREYTGGRSLCRYCKTATARGLDRVDSNGGYTPDNVVPCCSQCNYSKGRLSEGTFLSQCARVALVDREKVPDVPVQKLHVCKR